MFSPFICWFVFFVMSSVMPEAAYAQMKESGSDFRQDVFKQEDYHYLNVPRLGIYTMYDTFACTLKCLRNPSCFSVNLAASKGADGKLWCELLSTEKYRNPEKYKRNKTSHHLNSIQKPLCRSRPCKNGGTCVPNYKYHTFDCHCKDGFIGEYCEKAVESCQDLYNHDAHKLNGSQVVTLILDSKPTSVLCHMGDFGCGDGGWTPVMKMDGNKQTFHYNSNLWSNKETFNLDGGKTGFDSIETKLPSYWNTSFSKICLGIKIGQQIKFINITKQANSLCSLIADGKHRVTSLGRDTWKSLIGSDASLQRDCNKEGFNAMCDEKASKARIGILGNNQKSCNTCDSRIGFGTGGYSSSSNDDANTCGNEGDWSSDNGVKHIKGIGYILVQ